MSWYHFLINGNNHQLSLIDWLLINQLSMVINDKNDKNNNDNNKSKQWERVGLFSLKKEQKRVVKIGLFFFIHLNKMYGYLL